MFEQLLHQFSLTYTKLQQLVSPLGVNLPDERSLVSHLERTQTIAFVGEFKTGKSSLINSLLGDPFLPTGSVRTTKLITKLKQGPLEVSIHYRNRAEPTTIVPGAEEPPVFGIPAAVSCSEQLYELFLSNDALDQVRIVEIKHPRVPQNLIVIDTPGINDVSIVRSEVVNTIIPDADVVVFVISASKPFAETERRFLADRLLAMDLKKVIFVMNRMDLVQTEEEREELLHETEERLLEAVQAIIREKNDKLGEAVYRLPDRVVLVPTTCKPGAENEKGTETHKPIGFRAGSDSPISPTNGVSLLRKEIETAMTEGGRFARGRDFLKFHLLAGLKLIEGELQKRRNYRLLSQNQREVRLKELREQLQSLGRTFDEVETRTSELEVSFPGELEALLTKRFARLKHDLNKETPPENINSAIQDTVNLIRKKIRVGYRDLYREFVEEEDLEVGELNVGALEPPPSPEWKSPEDMDLLNAANIAFLALALTASPIAAITAGLGFIAVRTMPAGDQPDVDLEADLDDIYNNLKRGLRLELIASGNLLRRKLLDRGTAIQKELRLILSPEQHALSDHDYERMAGQVAHIRLDTLHSMGDQAS